MLMKKYFANFHLFYSSVILTFVLFFSSTSLVWGWTEPTLAPPGGNVSAPVNIGATTQSKSGAFSVLGNFGVGTASPLSKVQVDLASGVTGAIAAYSDLAAASRFTLSDASGLNDKIGLGAAFASGGASIPAGFVFGREGSSWGTFLAIHTHPNNSTLIDAYPERVRINSDGNVGIGTASPTAKLHVSGLNGQILATGSGYQLNPPGPILGQYSAAIGYIQAPVGGRIDVWNGVTEAIATFNNDRSVIFNGNVGIGTAAPNGKLTIGGAGGSVATDGIEWYSGPGNASGYHGYAGRIYVDVPPGGWGTAPFVFAVPNAVGVETKTMTLLNGNVGIGTASPTNGQLVISGNTNSASAPNRPRISLEDTAGTGTWLLQPWSTAGDGNLQILRNTGAGNLIIPSGNVGIGTTTPSQSLSVAGTIYSGTGGFKFPDGTIQTTAGGGGSVAVPTRQILTSGAGATYATPAGVRQLRIRMSGGGGGGGGFNASAGNATSGSAGGATTFNSISAGGGGGGGSNTTDQSRGGAGGSGGLGTASLRVPGNAGSKNAGLGGGSFFGGAPINGNGTATAGNAAANTGAGGSGGSWDGNLNPTGGGGAGEYVEIIINSPASSYVYTIGAGGAGGSQGTVGTSSPGGNGGSGIIIVDEIY